MEIHRSARADARGQGRWRARPAPSRRATSRRSSPASRPTTSPSSTAAMNRPGAVPGRPIPASRSTNCSSSWPTIPDYRLGQMPGTDDPAYWLNTAFMSGGVALRVKAGAAVQPSRSISRMSFPAMPAAAMYPRSVVVVEPGAQVTLIESFSGPDGLDYQVNSALELVIGDGARVDHIKIGYDGGAALARLHARRHGRRQGHLQGFRFHPRRRGGAQPDLRALCRRGQRRRDRRREPAQGPPARRQYAGHQPRRRPLH